MEIKKQKKKFDLIPVDGIFLEASKGMRMLDFEEIFFSLPYFGMVPAQDRCIVAEFTMQDKVSVSKKGTALMLPSVRSVKLRDNEDDSTRKRYFIVSVGNKFSDWMVGDETAEMGRPLRKGDEVTIPWHVTGIPDFPTVVSPLTYSGEEMKSFNYSEVSGTYRWEILDNMTEYGVRQIMKRIWDHLSEILYYHTEAQLPMFFEIDPFIRFQPEEVIADTITLIKNSRESYLPIQDRFNENLKESGYLSGNVLAGMWIDMMLTGMNRMFSTPEEKLKEKFGKLFENNQVEISEGIKKMNLHDHKYQNAIGKDIWRQVYRKIFYC